MILNMGCDMKEFNTTGNCVPKLNYMVDVTEKLDKIIRMIKSGDYFTINRPRQYGKTTTLFTIRRILLEKDDFLPVKISFEGVSDFSFETEKSFCSMILKSIGSDKDIREKGYSELFHSQIDNVNNLSDFSNIITQIITTINKKVVLMIDEVDAGSIFDVFLRFLGLLRDKFLNAREDYDVTFHSVILAGVTDIKTLKSKIRPDSNAQLVSPWNIAVDFDVNMTFNPKEIGTMLTEYIAATSMKMDINEISERIFFWTNGYPFLVSKICSIIDEKISPKEQWKINDVEEAVKILLTQKIPLFDYMVKYLENDPELSVFIESLVLGVKEYSFRGRSPLTEKAVFYGLVGCSAEGKIIIHNKIFEECLTDYYVEKMETSTGTQIINIPPKSAYLKPDGRLNFENILLKFQEAIKANFYNNKLDKSEEFLEADLRMQFMMFLKPLLNGYGHCFKEVVTGAEKRLDVVVVYRDEKFIVELKIWHGSEAHEEGKQQLLNYMKLESVNKGYMLIMSKNKNKEFKHEVEDGITMIWV